MILVRRIVGNSMLPGLRSGQLVVAVRWPRWRVGKVVIVEHHGLEKIKRIAQLKDDQAYLLGDNLLESKDSRHFGWVKTADVKAMVIWPR